MSLIHSTAVVDSQAKLGANVKIGAFCVVGPEVTLEDGVELKSHVVIENKVSIGAGTTVHSFAVIGGAPQNLKHHGIGAEVVIGKRTVIREYVTINLGTEADAMKTVIGDDCFIMTACHIAHDCRLGNKVIMANGATLGGHVNIDDSVFIGGMVAVHQFVRIGKYVMIGGMSGIERDVPPFAMMIGNRAKVVGLNIIGLKRNGFMDSDVRTIKQAYKILFEPSPGHSIAKAIHEVEQAFADNKQVLMLLDFLKAQSSRGLCGAEITQTDEAR